MMLRKKNKNYLIFILVIICSLIVTIEFVVIPWRFKLPRDLALMGFAGKPNTILYGTTLNSIGFTGDVIPLKKDLKKIRILTLGGSAMFIRNMTERLKDSLNKVSSKPVEIMGAALPTHNSMSSLLKYDALSKYKFNYVLIYHAANDIFVNNVPPEYFKSDFSHMSPWYKRNWLLDHSLIARVIYNNVIWGHRKLGTENWYLKYTYPEKDVENAMNFISEELFRRNITKLIENIQQDGGVPILMTFAWSIPDNYNREQFKSGALGYNNPDKLAPTPVELWGNVGYVKEATNRHNAVLRQIAKEHEVLLIDQENLIGKELRWFGDVYHLSEDGTDKFIRNITDFFHEHDLF